MNEESIAILEETSRTFFAPIMVLPGDLQDAVGSAYLCMRAIDEIEDHPTLPNHEKAALLREISIIIQSSEDCINENKLAHCFKPFQSVLPEVTLRLGEFAHIAPDSIAPRVWESISGMSDRMAYWALNGWNIKTEIDLNLYTYAVAGSIGLLLSDLWCWHDGTKSNRTHAVGFGRGLQAVNILRNRAEDRERGVNFYPENWDNSEMNVYVNRHLDLANVYMSDLKPGPARSFCQMPLVLARATVDALREGRMKLTRQEVVTLLAGCD